MRGSSRRRALGYGAAALLIAACTYDFDEYVDEPSATGGVASGAGGASAGSGEAGVGVTPEGGTTGGVVASGGAAGAAGSAGESGGLVAGAAGEAGTDAGSAGDDTGGTASGGAAANGGTTSGGTASVGGTPSAAGGAGGMGGAACDALGGVEFEGHCYFYVSSLLSFEAARSACAEASATLVAINSLEEQRFLESTFFAPANDAWIGLSLAELDNPSSAMCKAMPSACPFRWQTDEPLSYTKWGSHSATDAEPNYTGACVRMQGATLDWADQGCNERVRSICEAE